MPEEDEIDLLALAKTMWKGRRIILRAVVVCAVIGLAVAFLSPREYTSSTVVVPQVGKAGSKLGGISSLAAMAGFNLDMATSGEALSPMVYPQIVSSVPFQLELMNQTFTFSKVDHPVSLYTYYTEIEKPGILSLVKKYTLGLPGVILKALKHKTTVSCDSVGQLIALTDKQEAVRKMIAEKVTLEVNSKEGYLTLTANMPESRLAAEVAFFARELLQRYITRIKIEKASDQLNFIRDRYDEKKREFEKAQENLAIFRDRNRNVSTALAQTEEERLQSEYSIAFNVYSELAKQLEQAQIQVKEDTPVFSVLAPAVVPIEKSKPKKAMILAIWIFLGGIAGTGWVFGKQYLPTISQRWHKIPNTPSASTGHTVFGKKDETYKVECEITNIQKN